MWERLLEILRLILGDDHDTIAIADRRVEGEEPYADLTDEEVATLEEAIRTVAQDESLTADDLLTLADSAENIRAEQAAREDAAVAESERAAEARARILGETPPEEGEEEEPEGEETPEGEGAETPAAPAEGEEVPAEEVEEVPAEAEVPEPVRASSRPTAAALARTRPRQVTPPPARRTGLVASAGSGVVAAGERFDNDTQMGEALVEAYRQGRGSGIDGRAVVASGHWSDQYDSERRLDGDAQRNTERMMAATSPEGVEANFQRFMAERGFTSRIDARVELTTNPQSLTAAGGLCAPVNVAYDQFEVGTTRRPLRDSLTRFQATRGGLRYVGPPQLEEFAAAVGIHTVANDVSGATKNVMTVTCETEITVNVHAATARLQFGVLLDRFFPEYSRKVTNLTAQQHAREAEDRLWDDMCAATNVLDKTAGDLEFGAFRDIMNDLDRLAVILRDRHRTEPDANLMWWYPHWVWNEMRQDLYRQLPGDATPGQADRIIAQGLAEIGFVGVRVIDGGAQNTDFRGAIGDGGAIRGWPTTAETIVGFPGAFVFLDGGSLDFGTVRDSTLIAANNFQTFMETFEGIAHVAPESVCFRVNTCPTGKTSAAEDFDCGPTDQSS